MRLSSDMKKVLLMNSSFMIIFVYINIFVNLFIWEKAHKIADNALYNLIMYGILAIFFTLGSKLVMKFSIRFTTGLSSVFAALSFISLSFSDFDSNVLWLVSIAIPIAIMQGLFWSGMNLNITFFGKGPEFLEYYSAVSIINQIINIALPLLSAFVIKYFGFGSSFVLMFVFVAILLVSAFLVPKISLKDIFVGENQLLNANEMKKLIKKPVLRWIFPSNVMVTFFQQFQFIFALLFTFSITDDKVVIALLNVGYTVFCIIGLRIYKRFDNISQHHWLLIGLSLVAIGFLLVLYPKAPILVISNVLTTLGMFYFNNIYISQQYQVIEHENPINKIRVLLMREWFYAIGRVTMFSLLLFVKDFKGTFFISVLILAIVSSFVIPILQKNAMNEYKRTISKN